MLKELSINNLAIIDQVNIEFNRGVIAITGETGAGKSIILEAFELLMGKSAQTNLIRTGKETLVVEGVFELTPKLIEKYHTIIDGGDGELIVRREVSTSKQNKVFVNGRRSTTAVLKELFDDVVEVIGQHGNQILFSEKNHLSFLDELLLEKDKRIKESYHASFIEYMKVQKQFEEYKNREQEARDKYDLYTYQLSELKTVKLSVNEEVKLNEQYKILSHAEEIKGELNSTLELFNGQGSGVFSNLKKGVRIITKISHLHPNLEKISGRLESITLEFEDIFQELEMLTESVDVDDSELARVSKRLDELTKVKVKYHLEIVEILALMKEMHTFIENFSNSKQEILKLEDDIERIKSELNILATELTHAREGAARRLESYVVEALSHLGMPHTTVKVNLIPQHEFSKNGRETVQFLISTNKGESLKPMTEVLSGGEGSRVILALKTLFSEQKGAEILILDEIDMGVGGKTVEMMAEMIQKLPQTQVICITHSAHVAAKANQHFFIEKQLVGESTQVKIRKVKGQERVEEIARMIAGSGVTKQVLEHVEMLLGEK